MYCDSSKFSQIMLVTSNNSFHIDIEKDSHSTECAKVISSCTKNEAKSGTAMRML